VSKLKISICMPAYNGGASIEDTLESILGQSFKDFELAITDDNSTDETPQIIKKIEDSRIKFYRYEENVGYPRNLERCRTKCNNEIIFLMSQDDILRQGALEKVHRLFEENKNVGAITRPYYWFHKDVEKPVRATKQLSSTEDSIVSVNSDLKSIITVFQSLDQLSGLAFRREYMDLEFHKDIFTAHIYPFISIFKKYDVVYLKDYVIAARIGTSQTRHISFIYSKSPMQSWVDMFNTVLYEEKFAKMREYCIKNFVAKNFVGLIQVKSNGKMRWLLREIKLLLKYNKRNIIDPQFWFFSFCTLVIPSFLLRPFVDFYKENIISKSLKNITPIKVEDFERSNY
jgi:glycosyltransferase involved in cell wall biosynthesis